MLIGPEGQKCDLCLYIDMTAHCMQTTFVKLIFLLVISGRSSSVRNRDVLAVVSLQKYVGLGALQNCNI